MVTIRSSSRGKKIATKPTSTSRRISRGKTPSQLAIMTKIGKGKVVKAGKTSDGCNTIYRQGNSYFIYKYKPTGQKVSKTVMQKAYKVKRVAVPKP
jgi:hypothetical protein